MTLLILAGVIILAHFLATFLIWKQARVLGWSEEKVIDLVIVVSLFAIILGRVVFGLENWEVFQPNIVRLFLLTRYPGFSVLGAALGSVISLVLFAKWLKLSPIAVLDLFILPVMFSLGVVLASCTQVGCAELEMQHLGYGLLLLGGAIVFLGWFKKRLANSHRFSHVKRSQGLIFLLSIMVIQVLVLVLVKNKSNSLYSFYQLWLLTEFIVLIVWYQEIFKMIRLPASVLTQIKDYLEQKRKDTEEFLVNLKREDPTRDADRLHQEASDDDTAIVKAKHERAQALQLQLSKTLIEIKKALTKIKVGSYGICEACGKFIDTDRLAANPQATLCLEDEKKKERKK